MAFLDFTHRVIFGFIGIIKLYIHIIHAYIHIITLSPVHTEKYRVEFRIYGRTLHMYVSPYVCKFILRYHYIIIYYYYYYHDFSSTLRIVMIWGKLIN